MKLKVYEAQDETKMIEMIKAFWQEHNGYDISDEDAGEDLNAWRSDQEKLF